MSTGNRKSAATKNRQPGRWTERTANKTGSGHDRQTVLKWDFFYAHYRLATPTRQRCVPYYDREGAVTELVSQRSYHGRPAMFEMGFRTHLHDGCPTCNAPSPATECRIRHSQHSGQMLPQQRSLSDDHDGSSTVLGIALNSADPFHRVWRTGNAANCEIQPHRAPLQTMA